MRWKLRALATVLVFLAAANSKAEVIINFDYSRDTSGFFADGSTARATLEKAGADLAGNYLDNLASVAPGGGNTWTASFWSPAVENTQDFETNLSVPEDRLVVFVGAYNMAPLGQGGPGGWSALGGGSQEWYDTVYSRGQGAGDYNATHGSSADDFGPWGGSLAVDTDPTLAWNLDYNVAPTSSQYDLYSVLVHELAHVFGVGIADSWKNQEGAGAFVGPNAVAEHGGPVPMLGNFSHWNYDTMSTVYPDGAAQEAAMDPDIANGQRKFLTDLDVAGMEDMGWEAIPEPSTVIMLCSAAIFFFARTALRRGKQKP